MSDRAPRILLTVARTAVGLTAETSAAAVRAEVARVQEHPILVDTKGEPLNCALVPSLDPEMLGPERIYQLAEQALADVASRIDGSAPSSSLSLRLGVPERRPGWGEPQEQELRRRVVGPHGALRIEDARITGRGRVSGLVALERAANDVARGDASAVLVLTVDSHLDPQAIAALAAEGRTARTTSRSTFVAGEAVAAVLVGSCYGPAQSVAHQGVILSCGSGQEPNPILSDRECFGVGLGAALDEAIGTAGSDCLVSQTFIDINGERYREEEWGMAMLRHAPRFYDPLRYVAAARFWGDIGAASGAAFVCLATQAWARGYADSPTQALVAGSDGGQRGVVLLGAPTAHFTKVTATKAPSSPLQTIGPGDDVFEQWTAIAPVPQRAAPASVRLTTSIEVLGHDRWVSTHGGTVRIDTPTHHPEPSNQPHVTEIVPPIWEHVENMPRQQEEPADPTKTVRHQGRKRKGKRPGKLTLRVLDGPDAGRQQVVVGRRIRVGRSEAADFTIDHPSLSGLHFELRVRRNGIELFDLASKNGTILFGRLVYHARVHVGDVIIAGDCSIEMVDSAEIEVDRATEARQDGLLGNSETIQETFAAIDVAASCDLPTLVCGETGTGKELVARAIHRRSGRKAKPFIVLDCSAIPRDLAESIILGHRKGAFTGASEDKPGRFELAHEGTLFLDEIGELPLPLQAKLLRALASGEVTRVGESEARKVDVRIIAATHRDLPRMVDAETFRPDLYYRLAGFVVEVPTLQERGADEIEYLARQLATRDKGPRIEFRDDAIATLREYAWPGNIRELVAVITRASATCSGGIVEVKDLALGASSPQLLRLAESARLLSYDDAHAELDRVLLPRIVAECDGDLDLAAQRLGRPRRALEKRLRALRILGSG